MRVPTFDVSVVDLTVNLQKAATVDAINGAMRTAAEGPLKGILGIVDEPLVSVDFIGEHRSSLFDSASTMVMGDKFAKVISWYDNEMGYSARLWDLCSFVAQKL